MRFLMELKNAMRLNGDVSGWITCAQRESIDTDTKFVIAATQINNGIMCGGDGCEMGEWAWFNTVDDLYDYLLYLAIPLKLCELEGQDPLVVMDGGNTERLFSLEYDKNHVAIKEDLFRLYNKLVALRERNAGYQSIKEALLESNARCDNTDGCLIFRFYFFDGYREAGKELIRQTGCLNENRERVKTTIARDVLSEEDSEFLSGQFMTNGLW